MIFKPNRWDMYPRIVQQQNLKRIKREVIDALIGVGIIIAMLMILK